MFGRNTYHCIYVLPIDHFVQVSVYFLLYWINLRNVHEYIFRADVSNCLMEGIFFHDIESFERRVNYLNSLIQEETSPNYWKAFKFIFFVISLH